MSAEDQAPAGVMSDDAYTSRTGQKQANVPVQSDSDNVEDPIDGDKADTDAALEQDEKQQVQEGEVLKERTRGAAQPTGTYREPGDEEGLGNAEDGRSRVAGGVNN